MSTPPTVSAVVGASAMCLACLCSLTVVSTFAADKSGVSPTAISLPKGPGSIEGLGESFQPALNTGTAKYAIGLKLPPGTAGHQPNVSLNYEGGGGNGPLGPGWSLALAYVQRRTDKGIPTYGADVGFARTDVFVNETKEELVPQADGYYFCKNEGAFLRYRQVGEHWEATLPDGTRQEFGVRDSGRIADGPRIFCWLLEREIDTHGNVIDYSYRSFPGEQNEKQKYLATIRYGPGAPPWEHFHFVDFRYEDRKDWFEDGRPGFLVRTGKRLNSIVIGTQGAELAGHLSGDFDGDGTRDFLDRRYDLNYLPYAGTNSHWSLLEKVTLIGADGVSALPSAKFSYAVCNPPDELSAQGHLLTGVNTPTAVMDNNFVELADLNGDGLPDLLRTELGGAHLAFLNGGLAGGATNRAVTWSAPVPIDPGNGTAWNFDLASDRTHLADMDGDGLADLVHKSGDDSVFYFKNQGHLAWTERQEMRSEESAPPAPFEDSEVRTADLDFDKRIDIIQSIDIGGRTAFRIWYNLGGQKYSPAMTVEPATAFPFSLPGVEVADFNGDRVPDLARVEANAVVVAAGLGYGRFSEARSVSLSDTTLDDVQIARAKLTDLNGDGLADLVIERSTPGVAWYWLNLGNYSFSSRKSIVDLPATISQNAAIRWADLNGNGTTDLIYADSQATERIQAVDFSELFTEGLSPNTLTAIENGIGRVTRISYAPSTRFALDDAAAGKPWSDTLPFPVTVVSEVKVLDSLGHEYVSQFRYHGGYYDAEEKQFRGFAQVEQIEVGDLTAPTLVTRSQYDVGRQFEAMKGKLLRRTAEQTDGQTFWDETTSWTQPPRTLMVGTNGAAVQYVHPIANTRIISELGQGEPRRLETEYDYDNFGNQIRLANYGIVAGTNRFAFDDERITLTEFALNLDLWLLRKPKRQIVQDENGSVTARSEFFYDDESFSGANLGGVRVGNLTLRRDWFVPADPTAFVAAARTKYDAYGNAVASFDPLYAGAPDAGHYREWAYDDGFHAYPTRETIHIGGGKADLVFQAGYEEGFGTVNSTTDCNSHTTSFGYDSFARLVRVLKPGDSPEYPTTEYEYAVAMTVPGKSGGDALGEAIVNYIETRHLDRPPGTSGSKRDHYQISRQFVDGLGRSLMTRLEAEPAGESGPRVVVNGAVQFNARQQPTLILNPFFTMRTGSLDDLLAFEDVEAPQWRGRFHENGELVALNLPAAHGSRTHYDATLRPIQTVQPDASRARMIYEPLVTRIFDENDTDSTSAHYDTPSARFTDGLGRLVQVDERVRLNDDGTTSTTVNTWTTRYEYDLNDALTRITDAQNNVKLMRYDGLKRKTWMNDPDAGISTNRYDAASNLMETVDAKGQRITYTYDGANRVLTVDYHDDASAEFSYHRSPDEAYFYDDPAPSVSFGDNSQSTARNTKGRLAYVQDVTGEEHTSFDARGRVEWSVKRVADPALDSSFVGEPSALTSYGTRFEHDDMDRLTRLVYPDDDQIDYQYNERGLLQRIVGSVSGQIIRQISYLPSAQQNEVEYGNTVRTSYAFDRRQRLQSLLTASSASSGALIHFAYTYDAASNLRAIEDQRSASVVPLSDLRRNSQVFAYDDLYRLTRVQYNLAATLPSASGQISYRYDRIGNMLAQSSDIVHIEQGRSLTDLGAMAYGGSSGPTNRLGRLPTDSPGPHALSQIRSQQSQPSSYGYDANGNMTEIDGLHCTWDFKDRLVALENDHCRAEYRYDFNDRRIFKRVVAKPLTDAEFPRAHVSSFVVTYPGKHFEIRDHDEPIKYVFNDATRVARVESSLSANTRVQRLRLYPGWNLVSLAVTVPDALRQITNSGSALLSSTALYRWNPPAQKWVQLLADQSLEAGTVLWILAHTNATLAVTGRYADPVNRPISSGGTYFPNARLNLFSLGGNTFTNLAWSRFDPVRQLWQVHRPFLAMSDAEGEILGPGQAVYIHVDEPVQLGEPERALNVRYYHQDHLGSSSVMTDADGALVEETAFYPFGIERITHRPRRVAEPYKFTQKERDRESGLEYFEARYLAADLARFTSPDPKYQHPDALSAEDLTAFLAKSQAINLYSYAHNNPLTYSDPSGLDPVSTVSTSSDVVGIAAGVYEEASILHYLAGGNLPGWANTTANVAGKATAVISVGIKAVQFAQKPSSATGGQLANETAKALTGLACPPVGLIWSVLDLTGYGPSSILESTEASIKAARDATEAYERTTAISRQTTAMINKATPGIEAQQQRAAEGLKVLKQKTAKLNRTTSQVLKGDTRSLAELNAAIQKQEQINRRTAAELKRVQAQLRKAQE